MTDSQFDQLVRLVHRESGLLIDPSNRPRFERGLLSRARVMRHSVGGYLRLLSSSETELGHLLASISCGTTRFFRNASQLRALRELICPELIERRRAAEFRRGASDRPVRVWSAGCSTGEEAYTLAIVLRECLPPELRFEVIGTDLNARSIKIARRGWYEAIGSLPEELAARYLRPVAGGFEVSEEIRRSVTFRRHNLIRPGGPQGVDILACRNVLFYLSEPARRAALARLWEAMNPAAFLLIGNSERLSGWGGLFQPLSVCGSTVYRRLEAAAAGLASRGASGRPALGFGRLA